MYNISHDTYKFIERKADEFYTLELVGEEWTGVKYQYGNVGMRVETDENGEEYGRLTFTWQLIEGDESLNGDVEFQNYIGEVLNFIICDALDTGKYTMGDKDESTVDSDDYSEESAE